MEGKVSKPRGDGGKEKNAWSWASQLYEEGTQTSTEEQGSSPGQTQVDMHHLYLYIYL